MRQTVHGTAGLVAFAVAALISVLSGGALSARSEAPATPSKEEMVDPEVTGPVDIEPGDGRFFEELLIVGAGDAARRVAGSAHVIGAAELERQGYQDVHRVLRLVPGVNIQEEDGFGLRPNIGLRGTGVERSQKVTLLEDGVLVAPAPYSAPAAYYAPTAGRMEGFEVRKGSSAIRQGPYTNGGTINYLSSSIPRSPDVDFELVVGSDDQHRAHAVAGDSRERFGWLIEAYDSSHGGFKNLDGGGPTGFSLQDYMAKFRLNSPATARIRQTFEIKLGTTHQDGDETYVGLTEEDFRVDPYRRYASSAGDRILSDHDQIQLSYEVQPSPTFRFTVTVYRNDFFRNWAKLEKVSGASVAEVLADPASHLDALAVLRGQADSLPGGLAVRNNRRDYYSQGLQVVADWRREGALVDHRFDLGLRIHEDEEDRFQEEDSFQMLAGRRVFNERGAPGSHANRIARAEATALFLQDTIVAGRWTLTPGVRVESIDLRREDFGGADPGRSGVALVVKENSLTEVIPGLGVSYELAADERIFGGIHRGFSPPSPGSTEAVKAEESLNFELGYRHDDGIHRTELVAFYNDYDNLLGTDTVSGGGDGSGEQFNGGAAEIAGLEAGWLHRFMPRGRFVVPLGVTYTYTRARFTSSFDTSFADWAPSVTRGDEIPYIPSHQLNATVSLHAPRWALHLDGNYSAAIRTRAGSGPVAEGERVDRRTTYDVRGELTLAGGFNLFAQVLNLTDEVYIAARRPAGLRPGLPRSVLIGLRFDLGSADRSGATP